MTHVKTYRNVKLNDLTHTNKITQVFGIRTLFSLYIIKGGCLHGEEMDITHR